jgi:ABC-2 type transport system ATP-binding protein
MANAIEVRGLNYRADRNFDIRDLNLNVPAGSIYGFLGPNGAGKSTTIRLLLGMTRPLSGEISILGSRVPDEIAKVLQNTGYVPERPHLYPALTGEEALSFHSAFYPTWDASWSAALQKQFAIPLDRRIGRMSKGEVGKLLMLLALSQRPQLLMLDEPTDGLDPMVRRDVLSALLEYVSDTKATVFISSHLVHELERICDWVGVLDHGRLVAELPIEVFKNGVKRLRLSGLPSELRNPPFTVVSRLANGGSGETLVVRGWDDSMTQYLASSGATVREIVDLDLEEVFVEFLRSSRPLR